MSLTYVVPTSQLATDPTDVEQVHREARAVVNAAYESLPKPRPDVPWCEADDRLDAALLSGDDERALQAIRQWREWHLALFEEFGR